jgi:hypothetical protein
MNSAIPGVPGISAFIAKPTNLETIMTVRKLQTTPIAKAAGAVPEPKVETQTAWDKLQASIDEYFISEGLPSWKRQLTSFMLGLIGYGAVWYLGLKLVDILLVATVATTGPGFIAFMVLFIGFVLSLIAAAWAGYAVYNVAMSFEPSRIKNWFKRSAEPATA